MESEVQLKVDLKLGDHSYNWNIDSGILMLEIINNRRSCRALVARS